MNEPDRILSMLEPPPGGLARLLARRDAHVHRDAQTRRHARARWAPQWWALAAGAAAAVVWTAILSGRPEIHMQFSGARLIGERSEGVSAPILEGARVIPLPSSSANVRIYRIEPVRSVSVATK